MVTNGNSERAAHVQATYSSHVLLNFFFHFFFFVERAEMESQVGFAVCLFD